MKQSSVALQYTHVITSSRTFSQKLTFLNYVPSTVRIIRQSAEQFFSLLLRSRECIFLGEYVPQTVNIINLFGDLIIRRMYRPVGIKGDDSTGCAAFVRSVIHRILNTNELRMMADLMMLY